MAKATVPMSVDKTSEHVIRGGAQEGFEETLQPIPESARNQRVGGQFWIWAGANIAPINWVLGALGIHLGLGDTVPEQLAQRLAQVTERADEQVPASGAAQGTLEVQKAMAARG